MGSGRRVARRTAHGARRWLTTNDRDLNGHTDHGAGRARGRRPDAHGSRQRSQGDRAEQDHVGAARLRHGVNRDGSPRAFPRCMR
jgi:hypothetical protein